MASYCPECDWQLEIARRLVKKDRKQRWVWYGNVGGCVAWHISDTPMPYKDKVSVRWMPGFGVVHAWAGALLAHSAIGAV